MPPTVVIPKSQYTVGWIAPLILEQTAAIAVFDEPFGTVDVEGYACQGGRIGDHFVIIGLLTKGVTEQAALAAARIKRACINVECFLIVGIAGGVPSYVPSPGATPKEIVLGDVVVSTPGPGHGGIHTYDRGASKDVKGKSSGEFQVLTHNNGPDDRLLNTAKGLSETPEIEIRPREILQAMRSKIPNRFVSEYYDPQFRTNNPIQDRVFDAGCLHGSQDESQDLSCDNSKCEDIKCDFEKSKLRSARGPEAQRDQDTPWVHYGCIGVANRLQMSSFDRDRYCKGPYRLLAYEMETSGIIDLFPCLAIRGVCDYADGHKNKLWQRYAAGTAAAYAKFLLEGLPLSMKARHVRGSLRRQIQLPDKHSPPAFEVNSGHMDTFTQEPGAFVHRPTLLERINQKLVVNKTSRGLVCLHGMTGCGKTVIARHFARSHEFTARFELPGKSKSDFDAGLAKYAQEIPGLVGISDPPNLTEVASAALEPDAILRWQEDNINAIVAWLNRKGNHRWLILVDDLYLNESDDPEHHWIQEFLNKVNHGTIILTSQSSKFSKIYPSIKVGGLRPSESLLLMAGVLDTDNDNDIDTELDNSDRTELAALLKDHALSIDFAARYIQQHKITVRSYIQLWKSCNPSIFEDKEFNITLAPTVALAIQRLTPPPRRFLLLCSFLDPGCIWPELFPDLPFTRFETLVEELGAVSLIEAASMSDGERGRSVHPAVHKIIRHIALQQKDLERCITVAFSNIARALPDDLDTDVAGRQQQMLPHVEQCRQNLDLFHKYKLRVAPELLPCLGNIGWFLYQRGQLDDAEAFYDLALHTYESLTIHHLTKLPIMRDSLPPSQPSSAENSPPYRDADYYIIINSYGLVFKERGNIDMAQQYFEMVRDSFEETSAVKDTRDDLSQGVLNINLALSLRQNGRLEKARTLLQTARNFYEHQQDKNAVIQKCKIKQYFGSINKLEAEYYQASKKIDKACATLSSYISEDSLLLAIAKKELGSVYLLWDDPEHDCLATAQKNFEVASVGIKKHCKEDSDVYIDLQWHQHMLLMAQARRSEVDRPSKIEAACNAFDTFITMLNTRPKDDPIRLHALRTYGKWLQKLERWEDGQARLLSAIEGYKQRNNHQLDHAFAHKDVADGFFRRFDLGHHAAGPALLERATEHYQKARLLFESLHPDYAQLFIVNIDRKLEAIHLRLTTPPQELDKLREKELHSRMDEDFYDMDSLSSSRSSISGDCDSHQSPAFMSKMRDWIYELI